MLRDQRRHDDAAKIYRELLRIKPNNVEVLDLLAEVRLLQGRTDEAITLLRKATKVDPSGPGAHLYLGLALIRQKQFADAAVSLRAAYELRPQPSFALGEWAYISRKIADWRDFDQQSRDLTAAVRAGATTIDPFTFIQFSDEPADILACTRAFVAGKNIAGVPKFRHKPRNRKSEKIRVGYLSADFRLHPTTTLLSDLIEIHDRSHFEVVGVSIGFDDGTAERRRIVAAFDRFVDTMDWRVEEIAGRLHALDLDILVDLMGHTSLNQAAALASRPAPIQVNFLGYPGTIAADFLDYVIVDPVVAPPELAPHFAEKFVRLPDCYQPNDRRRPRPACAVTRPDCGLPGEGFVFACFNDVLKITPVVFDVWMRLLRAMPDSVLWLLESSAAATANLRNEASTRSVDPARIVVAPHTDHASHLARQTLVDLSLDTLPYNAHTTASDVLWMGVPIVTCIGRSFAARVCASVLHAAGMDELITHSLEEYEALALALARNPERLRGLRTRTESNRMCAPLFDTPRYCAHIESAYQTMMDIWRRGEKPRAFAVEPVAR
jgi:predicted O-linked N-acetylglucosamine transferase (SPINDLY family)